MMIDATKIRAFAIAGLGAAVLAAPALAHHSFAMFDQSKTETRSGTVEQFEYINPHNWIHLAVPDGNGGSATWSFEMGSVAQLNRDGWDQDTVKPGDEVEIGFHPLKDGSNGGQFRYVVFADGHAMCQGGAGQGGPACNPEDYGAPTN
jgi:hypothetical protein